MKGTLEDKLKRVVRLLRPVRGQCSLDQKQERLPQDNGNENEKKTKGQTLQAFLC